MAGTQKPISTQKSRGSATMAGGSQGNIRRRKEKEASAKIRGRKKFDDQSNVDKIYKWVKNQKWTTNPTRRPWIPPSSPYED